MDSGLSASTCRVCKQKSVGLVARCSGKNCKVVFHVGCATSTVSSRKYSSIFYRCESCSAVEMQKPKGVKRPNKGKAPNKKKAAAAHPKAKDSHLSDAAVAVDNADADAALVFPFHRIKRSVASRGGGTLDRGRRFDRRC